MQQLGKRQLGAPTREIQCSRGADQNSSYGFYSTSYGKSFSKPQFIPKASWRDRSTGYASNFRPSVSYSYRLDENDNPTLGKYLHENKSNTVYRKDYDIYSNLEKYNTFGRGAIRSTPDYFTCPPFFQLPTATYQTDMGYTKDIPITRPFTRDVCSVHVDTRELGPKQILGRTLPHFSEPKGSGFTVKSRVEEENAGLGPLNFSTEQKASYPKKTNRYQYEGPKQISIGAKEESGFTHSKKIEPVTFRNDQAYQDGAEIQGRTGNSMMKEDFHPKRYQQLPSHYHARLCKSADITNGFIKGHRDLPEYLLRDANINEAYTSINQIPPLIAERTKRSNPAEHMNLRLTNQKCSITQDSFPIYASDRIPHPAKDRSIIIGRKEESGYVENKEESNLARSMPDEIQSQFTTYYSEQYNLPQPDIMSQMSRVTTAPQLPLMNGYTKSTKLHFMGQEPTLHPDSTNKLLQGVTPIVAKIMLAKEPMLTDMPHLHKARNVTSAVY